MTDTDAAARFHAEIAAAQGHVDAKRWRDAAAALERAVALQPNAEGAWRSLGMALREAGDVAKSSAAHDRAARLAMAKPPLSDAAAAIEQDKLATAEGLIRARLKEVPTDIAAICLLAELATRAGNLVDAKRFLNHALEIAPEFEPARAQLARIFYDNRDLPEALAEFDRLISANPVHHGYCNLRAATLDLLGDHAGAAAAYHAMLADDPNQPLVWMTLGNVSKTIGDIPVAIAAFRRSVTLAPSTGESWWGLANLKSFRFDDADIATMQAELAKPTPAGTDRVCLEFALGSALEERADHAASFAHYSDGNAMQLAHAPHDPDALATFEKRCTTFFTSEFLDARAVSGDPAPDPIFILGMPRSGSTLVEQMLASHPAIEGTLELPELPRIARMLGADRDPARSPYPDNLAQLSSDQLAGLGAEYLRRAAHWRQTDRPYFIDKLPMNFMNVGLIRLILPNARIIDVRRHPLGCGFSVFKQYFPRGLSFSTSIDHIGRFYADYVRMMQLWDDRLPGFVHRVIYEQLVADPEAELRRMLDFVGVPFDPACLDFHTSLRAVATPSAEQVRRPIYTEGVDHWRHYEAWLGPMKEALGEVLARYPAAP
ncbi:tetratricopeptide repeat protein [Sphingomonas panacisoli]|uniref:Tetratricopeptide repeat protein n=1 Tax=Sphingomonas panacisoli TaxID=1813879 RepID=A0A5B8LHJ3_9SPHN|nr:tetratricopeptide repeat-containing sulfotransferase family protein [Sphingomonas panacisoli]QDZ07511.1 tetratricopeptide repeat protein [Sphingomonas panacisoli]